MMGVAAAAAAEQHFLHGENSDVLPAIEETVTRGDQARPGQVSRA